jgi:hypothetical protein
MTLVFLHQTCPALQQDHPRRQCNESGDADDHDHQKDLAHYFSRLTPLNFFAAVFFPAGCFTAMNSPEFLLRLVQAVTPPRLVLSWVRFFTAPLRALSPVGLLTAVVRLPFSDNARRRFFVPRQELGWGFG